MLLRDLPQKLQDFAILRMVEDKHPIKKIHKIYVLVECFIFMKLQNVMNGSNYFIIITSNQCTLNIPN